MHSRRRGHIYSPRFPCAEMWRSKTTSSVCLSSQDAALHSQSWHTGLMWTAWEWKLLWKSFSDFNRTERPAWEHTTTARGGEKAKNNPLDVENNSTEIDCLDRDKMHSRHSLRIHTATVSSRVLNSRCKLFPEEVWHSEGSDGLSLQVQHKKSKDVCQVLHAG